MPHIIVKGPERKAREDYVARVYGVDRSDRTKMDAVECVAARTDEAVRELSRLESQKTYVFNGSNA